MKEKSISLNSKVTGTRILAFFMALVLCITGIPMYSTDTVEASSDATWDSWEELYNHMLSEAEEDGLTTRGAGQLFASVYHSDTFWSSLVDAMDELDVAGATDYEKVCAIANWIAENASYSTDGIDPHVAYGVFEDGLLVCEGYAGLFCIMCEYTGVEATVISCSETNHAWNAVKVDGNWYLTDVTSISESQLRNGLSLGGKDSYTSIYYTNTVDRVLATDMAEWAEENISDYSYLYYNSSCNGEHNFQLSAVHYSGWNYVCESGFEIYLCADCGCTHVVRVDCETEHSYVEYTVEPTCTTEGYSYKKCSVCGEYELLEDCSYSYKYDIVDALGHDYSVVKTIKEATCTTSGYAYSYCSVCGNALVENGSAVKTVLAATGHDWDEGVITTAATATTAGVKTYTCQTCGVTKTESIAATGGDLTTATVELSCDTYTYDGTSHFPEVTVYIDGIEVENTVISTTTGSTTKVVSGASYTVTYRTGAAYKAAGQVPVVISAGTNGLLTGEITVYFTIEKADTTVTASIDSDTILAGETAQITASAAVDTTGTSRTVYYESSDTSVATVSSSGLVTGVSSGVAVITIYTAANASYYNQGYAYITVTVTEEGNTDISDATVVFGESKSFYTYDGTAKEPSFTVMLGSTELTAGEDYMVSYSDNTDAGTATVTIAGCGSYTGSVTKTFTITQADMSDAAVELGTDSYTYDGTAKEPSVTVTTGNVILTKGTDYTVAYSDNTDAGTATVTITGCGNYTGTVTKTFTIASVDISSATVTLSSNEFTYDGTEKTPTATVSVNGTELTSGTDYTVSYSNNVNAGTATVTVTGCGNYTGSYNGKFLIAKADATVSANDLAVYCGNTADISATSTSGGTLSYTSSDSSVASVDENGTITGVSAGTATILIMSDATDNYNAAETTITVTVSAIDISDATVSLDTDTYTYDGTAKTPTVTVKLNGSTLTQNTDYLVSYSSNVNAGTATVTISGCGNYTGILTKEYTISKASQVVTISGKTEYTKGDTISLSAEAYDDAEITWDYGNVVTALANGIAGTYTVTATAAETNNYLSGKATVTITITETVAEPTDISDATVELESDSYTYDGSAKTPTATVSVNGTTLTEDTDYTVSYSDNTDAGTATMTITGCGNYTGTVTDSFTINKASQSITLSDTSVSIAAGNTSSVTATASGNGTITWSSSDTSVATVSSGTITGVSAGTATITVSAAATDNYNKTTKTIKVTVKPAAPKISSVSNTTSGVKITWGKVTGATGYYVYRATSSGGTYTKIATISSGSTVSYTNKTSGTYAVSSGKTYYYKVYAYAAAGKSSASSAKSIRYLTAGKVSSLTNTSTGITVKWSKVTGASGYYVYRKTGSGSYTKIKTITSGSTVSYTDTAVKSKNGTTYTYAVKAYYKSGSTTYTSSYTGKKTVRMTAVSLSSVKNSSSKKMTVKWAKNSKATGYQIQYSTSSSFASGNKTVTVTGASSVSKVISSLTKGKTYYVRIRAYKTVDGTKYYSAWSSKKSVKISK